MLSILAALFGFRCLIANLILPLVRSPERLALALGVLLKYFASPEIFLVKALSTSGNLPLLISCFVMTFSVMGQGVGLEAWPVSLFKVD